MAMEMKYSRKCAWNKGNVSKQGKNGNRNGILKEMCLEQKNVLKQAKNGNT